MMQPTKPTKQIKKLYQANTQSNQNPPRNASEIQKKTLEAKQINNTSTHQPFIT